VFNFLKCVTLNFLKNEHLSENFSGRFQGVFEDILAVFEHFLRRFKMFLRVSRNVSIKNEHFSECFLKYFNINELF